MQEVQAEQELMRKTLSVARKRIEDLQLSLSSHNDKLQSARETRNKLVENQLKMTSEVQKLKQLQNKLKDLSAEEVSLQQNVNELQQQLAPFNQQLEAKSNLLLKTKVYHVFIIFRNKKSSFEVKRLYLEIQFFTLSKCKRRKDKHRSIFGADKVISVGLVYEILIVFNYCNRKVFSMLIHYLRKVHFDFQRENNEVLESNRSAIAEKSKSLHALKSVQSEIESCIRRGVVESLKKSESDMKKYQQMINELERNKNAVSESINEIMHQISTQETHKREMSDNMTLKVKTAGAEVLQSDITELRNKLGDMNYRQLMQQKRELKEQEEVLIREVCILIFFTILYFCQRCVIHLLVFKHACFRKTLRSEVRMNWRETLHN